MEQKNQVPEYQKLMKQAPKIHASGLKGDYRALAEFNNVALAGHQTRFEMEFVTRSGLFPQEQLFSDQQLTEMYLCIHETLENGYPITVECEKLLTESAE